jgi:hypothetical protein
MVLAENNHPPQNNIVALFDDMRLFHAVLVGAR